VILPSNTPAVNPISLKVNSDFNFRELFLWLLSLPAVKSRNVPNQTQILKHPRSQNSCAKHYNSIHFSSFSHIDRSFCGLSDTRRMKWLNSRAHCLSAKHDFNSSTANLWQLIRVFLASESLFSSFRIRIHSRAQALDIYQFNACAREEKADLYDMIYSDL
jgi:hypothetical protein